jgi:hypothetical protein
VAGAYSSIALFSIDFASAQERGNKRLAYDGQQWCETESARLTLLSRLLLAQLSSQQSTLNDQSFCLPGSITLAMRHRGGKMSTFAGFGVGFGVGIGCGGGAGSGVGGTGMSACADLNLCSSFDSSASWDCERCQSGTNRDAETLLMWLPVSAWLFPYMVARCLTAYFCTSLFPGSNLLTGLPHILPLPGFGAVRLHVASGLADLDMWSEMHRRRLIFWISLTSSRISVSICNVCAIQGGGCGVGAGFGWGFFFFGYGVVVRSFAALSGHHKRMVNRAARQLQKDREAGLRPPRRDRNATGAGEMDALLDRIIRHLETRRAR